MEQRPGTSDDLAVVIDLRPFDPPAVERPADARPSEESLAEVRAEALLRAAARRAVAAQESAPSATRRGTVASLVCGLLLLAVAAWPTVSGLFDDADGAPVAPTTIRQDLGAGTDWDPWVDPFEGTLP